MRKWIEVAVLALAAGAMGGCNSESLFKAKAEPAPPPAPQATYLDKTAIRDETDSGAGSAVDTALEWARKYSEVTTTRDHLLEENRQHVHDKQQHQQDLSAMEARALRAEQELAEANAMLAEMRGELNQWKASVLGFRQEMLDSQKAQLTAMYQIMRLVGGEVVASAGEKTGADAAAAPAPAAQNEEHAGEKAQ